jgi:hypothetical protein
MVDGANNLQGALSDLGRVPWSRLRTAHGTAERVPEVIRGLASSDPEHVDNWYWQLDNVVVLQGSVYEAAYYVIPAMLGIIDSQLAAEIRSTAYDLLIEIARGVPGDDDRASIVNDSGAIPLITASKQLIRNDLERFKADLLGSDRGLRQKALDLLVSLDLPPSELAPLLESVEPGDDQRFAEALDREIGDLGT